MVMVLMVGMRGGPGRLGTSPPGQTLGCDLRVLGMRRTNDCVCRAILSHRARRRRVGARGGGLQHRPATFGKRLRVAI
ncbi:hypothetical protein ASF33_02455 [Methylobacterium sp. Leaf92]|nr:hypothetical protein ASF33_02455 [Methylobacterium sp. Leaf92]